jgi:hypothetical protein
MANNYSAVITIPLAQEALFIEGNYVIYGQFGLVTTATVSPTLIELFDRIVVAAEGEWGGSLSYVITNDGTNSYYTFTWSGITPTSNGFPQLFLANLGIAGEPTFLPFTGAICLNCPEVDLTICDECRNITLEACADSYKIVAGLTPATNYFVTIQDRNNDLYIQEITSDGNGDVTIDATSPEFPAGFWLTESGNKVIRIYADASLEQPEDITVDTTVYSCVLLNLQYYYTTTT